MATLSDTVQTAFDRAAAQRTLVLPTIPEELHALEADELLDGATEPLEAIDARDLIIADGNFSELEASHARFTNCFLSCCDFSGALFTDTVFEECDFANTYFDSAGFTRCTFNDRFIGTSFFRTPLLGIDFTTCQLEGVALSDTMAEIYGTKMNVYQAAALARRLGVIVAE